MYDIEDWREEQYKDYQAGLTDNEDEVDADKAITDFAELNGMDFYAVLIKWQKEGLHFNSITDFLENWQSEIDADWETSNN